MPSPSTDEFPGFFTPRIQYFTPEQRQFCAIDLLIERSESELEIAKTKTEIKTCLVGIVVKWTEMAQLTTDYCQRYDVDENPELKKKALRLLSMVKSLGYEMSSIAEPFWKTIEMALEMKLSDFNAMMENLHMEERSIVEEPTKVESAKLIEIFGSES